MKLTYTDELAPVTRITMVRSVGLDGASPVAEKLDGLERDFLPEHATVEAVVDSRGTGRYSLLLWSGELKQVPEPQCMAEYRGVVADGVVVPDRGVPRPDWIGGLVSSVVAQAYAKARS